MELIMASVKKDPVLLALIHAEESAGLIALQTWMIRGEPTPKDANGYQIRERLTRKVVAGYQYELTTQQALNFCIAYAAKQKALEPKARALAQSQGFELKPVRSGGFRLVLKSADFTFLGTTRTGYQPVTIIEYLNERLQGREGDGWDAPPRKSPPPVPAPARDPHFDRFMKNITETV
jgi:hypothetical protein